LSRKLAVIAEVTILPLFFVGRDGKTIYDQKSGEIFCCLFPTKFPANPLLESES